MAMDDGDGVDCTGRWMNNDLKSVAALGTWGHIVLLTGNVARNAWQLELQGSEANCPAVLINTSICKNTAIDGLSPKTTWVLTDYASQTSSGFSMKCVTGEKIWFQAT